MAQPTAQSPFDIMAAQLYPEDVAKKSDEPSGPPTPSVNNFDDVFHDIGRLQKQSDHGRAEISGKGGLVARNLAIKPGEQGYFGSLCAMRWSNAMTDHGNALDPRHVKDSGTLSISDKNRNQFVWRVPEVKKYLDASLNNGVDVINDPGSLNGKKGFLVIIHPKVTGRKVKVPISGHVTAWDGHQTADHSDSFMNGAKHIYFYEVQSGNTNQETQHDEEKPRRPRAW